VHNVLNNPVCVISSHPAARFATFTLSLLLGGRARRLR